MKTIHPLYSLIILVVALVAAPVAMAAPAASEVVKTSADKLRKMNSLTASVVASGDKGSANGKILLSGQKFAFTTRDAQSVWYDGKTQWVYNPSVNEINISEPTADELASINPFMIINSFEKSCKATMEKSGQGTYTVRLTPTAKGSDYTSIVITFNSTTYLPTKVVLNTRSVGTVTISISNIKQVSKPSNAKFSPSKKDYPTAEFVDLR